ncbi:hypothetical protein HNQ56_000422 [Anaerotaenia torta]|uniref:hypothetical protein n=1 Tax=Anaerotaenia torta TaxID=433293 RepID=UPI003D2075DE
MSLVLNILIIICSVIGIIVCAKGIKKNILYRGGLYFFILLLIEKLYSLIVPIFIEKLIAHGIDNPGLWIRNLTIPPLLIMAIAIIILVIFLIRGLRENIK